MANGDIVTLIDVGAIAASFILSKSVIADTPEHSEYIFTLAKNANVVKHLTFVDINTRLCYWIFGESHVTLTPIATSDVQTLTIVAEIRIKGAFVLINTVESVSGEAFITDTVERAIDVIAGSIPVASAIIPQAFVEIFTSETVPNKTFLTPALVRPQVIEAVSVHIARMGSQFTFVIVCTARSLPCHRKSILAPTIKRPHCIFTLAIHAKIGIRDAFINIYAASPILRWHQPPNTVTCVCPRVIGALPAKTDLRIFAFVHVSTLKSIREQHVAS